MIKWFYSKKALINFIKTNNKYIEALITSRQKTYDLIDKLQNLLSKQEELINCLYKQIESFNDNQR